VAEWREFLLNCLRRYADSSPSHRFTAGPNRAIFEAQTFKRGFGYNRVMLIITLVLSYIPRTS